jgi:ParB-like chromosome segregation protein Spo0J
LLGEEMIPCTYVEDDDDLVRQVQIAENLFRRNETVLKQSEMLAEWVEHTEGNGGGQVDRKPKGGRPKSSIAKVAREIPLLAGSDEGGRKRIDVPSSYRSSQQR